jgi:hypothetical protein
MQIPTPPLVTLPWEPFELGSITDVVSICLALIVLAFTVFIALRQLKIMKQQTTMMTEQTAINKRQELVAIRQGEIAAIQHRIMLEQLVSQPILSMRALIGRRVNGLLVCDIAVTNLGSKGTPSFAWFLYIPIELQESVSIASFDDKIPDTSYEGKFKVFTGSVMVPVYRGLDASVVRVRVKVFPDSKPFIFDWKIVCEDGYFPTEGRGKLIVWDKVIEFNKRHHSAPPALA